MLRNAMVKNPYMKVPWSPPRLLLISADALTHAVEYTFNLRGAEPSDAQECIVGFTISPGTCYTSTSDSHTKLKHDVSDFIQSCLPQVDLR